MLNNKFKIGGRLVGKDEPCFIIAEAGVSHFGSFQKAIKLVDMAKEGGADAVKFQIFNVDKLIAGKDSKWKDRLAPRALPYSDFKKLSDYCNTKGIIFFATAHDESSLEYLTKLNPPVYKIGSGEYKNHTFLKKIACLGKPVIFSTGMHSMQDVEDAVSSMASTGNKDISVLQCVTEYPTSPEDVNLRVMDVYRRKFGDAVGFSDHTKGYHIPLAAAARGAKVIEKHITLEYDIPNAQDWKVSCGPENFVHFVSQVRDIEKALGSSLKQASAAELVNVKWARKSIVTRHDLSVGDTIYETDLDIKRPGDGIAPTELDKVIGKKLARAKKKDQLLAWEDFE